jgi:single-strand DNA-binding protein
VNINRVVVTGNLTADPDLKQMASGNSVCRLSVASNTRRRQPDGNWGDKPNYFDVVVWGAQGQAAQHYLSKGSPIAVDGRLEWREWTTESGDKRQTVEIIAENLQFLGGGQSASDPGVPEPPIPPADDDVPF